MKGFREEKFGIDWKATSSKGKEKMKTKATTKEKVTENVAMAPTRSYVLSHTVIRK